MTRNVMLRFITIKTICNHTLYVNFDDIGYVMYDDNVQTDLTEAGDGVNARPRLKHPKVCLMTGEKYEICVDEYEKLKSVLLQAK